MTAMDQGDGQQPKAAAAAAATLSNLQEQLEQHTASSHQNPRRKVAHYAGASGRELSWSAKKRQSIHALGSIRHLQHRFAKHGLAAEQAPQLGPHGKPLPLAVPGYVPSLAEHPSEGDDEDELPPSPEPPQQIQQEDMHGQIEVPSLRSRKKEVYANIAQVCERWDLVEMSRQASSSSTASTSAPPPSDRPARGASIISIPMSSSTALPPSRSRSPTKHPGSSALHHHDSISEYGGSNIGSNASGSGSLVPNLIEVTTAAIRSAQRYFLSLPPEKLPFTSNQISSQQQKPTASLGLITAARPIPRHTLVSSLPSTSSRQPSNPATRLPAAGVPFPSQNDDEDPLLKLRKVSLDTLGALKEMERRLRLREPSSSSSAAVAHRTPSSEQAALVASLSSTSIASGSGSGIGQPSLVFSEDLSSASDVSSSLGAHDVDHSATGHLYREDVNLADLQAEARVVRSWIETVDGLLSYKSIASPSRERRSSSPGSDRCPAWARKAIEVATPLERLLECLRAHLPPDLLERLPEDPTSNPAQLRTDLLHALSDGQLLCVAYNVALRKSQRPWGFLNPTSIHDIASILKSTPMSRETSESSTPTPTVSNNKTASTGPEGSAPLRRASSDLLSTSEGPLPRVGMTFRRFENLRLFLAAIKLRYLITLSSSVDSKAIAQKAEGWQDMLEEAACKWLEAVAREKRDEQELEAERAEA